MRIEPSFYSAVIKMPPGGRWGGCKKFTKGPKESLSLFRKMDGGRKTVGMEMESEIGSRDSVLGFVLVTRQTYRSRDDAHSDIEAGFG